jgi:hypothetical protein
VIFGFEKRYVINEKRVWEASRSTRFDNVIGLFGATSAYPDTK